MKNEQIARRRMHNLGLWGAPSESPQAVVHRLGALQAQEYHFAKWSVAQRAKGVDDASMQKAFDDGVILRTHFLRPTWHFVLAADIRWLLDLSGPRVNALNAFRYRQLELDDKLLRKTNALLVKALRGGRQLTRKALATTLDRAGIETGGQRMPYILMRAELDAVICSGALEGKQHTYALLDERAPQAKTRDRDEALAELTKRYFTARGPATLNDYSRWSSFTVADCRDGLAMVASQLESEVLEGRTYWFAASSQNRSASKRIDLVQCYDECIMSYSESRDVLLGSLATSAFPEERTFMHAVVLDGRMVGRWKRTLKKDSVVVESALFRPLTSVETRALESAIDRLGRFLGVPVARG